MPRTSAISKGRTVPSPDTIPRPGDRGRDYLQVDGVEIGDAPGGIHLLAERHQHEAERGKLNRLVHDNLHPLASTFGVASGRVYHGRTSGGRGGRLGGSGGEGGG